MHTARQLDESLFTIEIDGRPTDRAALLRGWGPLDRLGVVTHEPLGTIGASHLLQLAITAFYDARPARRDRERPVYPDVFVFHVGGRWGDHADFDVYPPRKEVFVDDDPRSILEAINDRGITRLVVPDRAPEPTQHGWKEPAQALDRIVDAWAYSPTGRVAGGDVAVSASGARAEANVRMILEPTDSYHERQQMRAHIGQIRVPADELLPSPPPRTDEAPEDLRRRLLDRRRALEGPDGARTETYRRIAVADALRMLHRGAAPAFVASGDVEALMDAMVDAAGAGSATASH
ncbi:MAG: hypothetical protein M0P31_05055 [Solirubrobacteraceae bacterium]|nr:hypothetical protein [Solirubrobacteraceae bacterium]